MNTALNSKANSSDLNNYLPISAGEITGPLYRMSATNKKFHICDGGVNDATLTNVDFGWSWDNRDGSGFAFRSVDFGNEGNIERGAFIMWARDASNSYSLTGKCDGTLTWDGKNIIREEAKTDGTSANYVQFSNGLIINYGYVSGTTGNYNNDGLYETNSILATFAKAFSTTTYGISVVAGDVGGLGQTEIAVIHLKSTSAASFITMSRTANTSMTVYYMAIGF